jgi:hypothetical protein
MLGVLEELGFELSVWTKLVMKRRTVTVALNY